MSSSSDRKAKIQAASSKGGGGANAIVVAGIVAVLAIIAVVGGVIWASQRGGDETATGSEVPKGAKMGEPFVPARATKAGADAPTVDVYEDFRCPACQALEGAFGPTIEKLADEGKINLRYNFRLVIDESANQKSSLKAASSAICAADQGKWTDYHATLFTKQPENHGEFTDQHFTDTAKEVGLSGEALKTFTTCTQDQQYGKYVQSVNEASAKGGVNSTPTIKVNDQELNWGAFVRDDNSLDIEGFSTALTTGELPAEAKK